MRACRLLQRWQAGRRAFAHLPQLDQKQIDAAARQHEAIFRADQLRNKQTFLGAIDRFIQHSHAHRRGHVEFIYAAMKLMEPYGVLKDLDSYKKLLAVFPKSVMIPTNKVQAEFMHYPKQQSCAVDLLFKMQMNTVIPDEEVGGLIYDIFGDLSFVFRAYQAMMYWMPKFRNADPSAHAVPVVLPTEPTAVASLALRRMCPDPMAEISVFDARSLQRPDYDGFVVSLLASKQRHLLALQPPDSALFVEGPATVWLRDTSLQYFVLKSYVKHSYCEVPETADNFLQFRPWLGARELPHFERQRTVHEQPDGTILSLCSLQGPVNERLVDWIAFLQKQCPCLQRLSVVYKVSAS